MDVGLHGFSRSGWTTPVVPGGNHHRAGGPLGWAAGTAESGEIKFYDPPRGAVNEGLMRSWYNALVPRAC
jgi:hypothetical protein